MSRKLIAVHSPAEWDLKSDKPAIPDSSHRYVVKKDSGSYWARLVDTKTGMTGCRSNVLKKDAWANFDKHCDRLNERDRVSKALYPDGRQEYLKERKVDD